MTITAFSRLWAWNQAGDRRLSDVWWVTKDAAEYFIRGLNPYLVHSFPSLVEGRPFQHTMFVYMPITFIATAPFVLFGLDIRWLNILSDLVITAVLFKRDRLAGLFWAISQRVSLFSVVVYCNDLFTIALFGVAFYLSERARPAGVLLGLSLASKQLAVLSLPYFIFMRKWKELSISLIIFLAIVVPFLNWDMVHQMVLVAIVSGATIKFGGNYLLYPLFLLLYWRPFETDRISAFRSVALFSGFILFDMAWGHFDSLPVSMLLLALATIVVVEKALKAQTRFS